MSGVGFVFQESQKSLRILTYDRLLVQYIDLAVNKVLTHINFSWNVFLIKVEISTVNINKITDNLILIPSGKVKFLALFGKFPMTSWIEYFITNEMYPIFSKLVSEYNKLEVVKEMSTSAFICCFKRLQVPTFFFNGDYCIFFKIISLAISEK